MAKSNGWQRKSGGRRFDTRLSFNEMARILGLNVKQKINMRRYIIYKMKGGGQIVR